MQIDLFHAGVKAKRLGFVGGNANGKGFGFGQDSLTDATPVLGFQGIESVEAV